MAGTKFYRYHWNRLEKGSTVVVRLSRAANVRLMDSTNFNAYKNGRDHRCSGGLVTKVPFRIRVPRTGSWYLSIDLMGLKATDVRHSVEVEPPPLPTAKSVPLQSLDGIRHERPRWGRTTTARPGMCSSPTRVRTRSLSRGRSPRPRRPRCGWPPATPTPPRASWPGSMMSGRSTSDPGVRCLPAPQPSGLFDVGAGARCPDDRAAGERLT